MPDVVLTHVSKSFGRTDKTPAVSDLSLRISDGELLTIVGPSGSGKTTLLRLISGIETPDFGTITISGCIVNDVAPGERNIAMVFQSFALYPHLTVRENLGFPLKVRKLPKSEIAARVSEVAQMLGLSELLDRNPDALSSGERQRVALGRALAQRPEVFLFDEPLANVDAALRFDLRRLIADLQRRLHATMIYVTHDQTEAMTLGDRVAVLRHGKLEQVGTPAEIYDLPATRFVAEFIGSPGMNSFPGSLNSEGDHMVFQFDSPDKPSLAPLPLRKLLAKDELLKAGNKLFLGIRPEHAYPVSQEPPTLIGVVDLVERTGAETVLYVSNGSNRLSLRVRGTTSIRAGDQLPVRFDPDHFHLFAADSGRRIA
jgi:ABC-type sugar transport system ATPase subunit